MGRFTEVLRDIYIRFLVWLGAEPPPGYEHLIAEEARPREYTLKPGDTLFSVARHFGVHYDLIAKANNIEEPGSVEAGQTLVIPAPDWSPPAPEAPALPKPPEPITPPPPEPPQVIIPPPPVEEIPVKEAPVEEPPVEEVSFEPRPEKEGPSAVEVLGAAVALGAATIIPEQKATPPKVEEQEPEWLTAPELREETEVEERAESEPFEWLMHEETPVEAVETAVEVPSEEVAPAPEEEMVFRYEVQRGDTLSAIARKYGVTFKELVEANNIADPATPIFPGQKLVIPGYMAPKPTPPAEALPVTRPLPEVEERFVYTIASGDTLNSIAKRYGITVRELIEANQIENPNQLRIGQKLVIPGVIAPARPEEVTPPPPKPAYPPRPFVQGTNPNFPPLGPRDAVRAVYISYFAIGHNETRQHVLELLDTTELNTMVIDIKSDFGWISYPTQLPLAREIGAIRPTIKALGELLQQLKSRGIYTIARIVPFKDNPLAKTHPELAVKSSNGAIWQDAEETSWVDPFLKPVWDYNIQVAVEAAKLGFDEIQFDGVRFPVTGPAGAPQFSQEVTRESRVAAVTGFLSTAHGQLAPLGVKVGANILGYACWRKDDAAIGQDLERMGQYLDVLSPVLHPSTFSKGIPGYKMAVAHPYEVVYHSTKQAVDRLKATACAVRPWIQDFPDYRFDRRVYGKAEIQAQIKGCFDAGATGFMVWDPQVNYTQGAYAPAALPQPAAD